MRIVAKTRPIGKERPRTVKMANGNYRTYTPKNTQTFENEIRAAFIEGRNKKLPDLPLEVNIKAIFAPPKSLSMSKQKELIRGCWRDKTPDIDNIAKAVLDALNGLAWVDDSRVCMLSVSKEYGLNDAVIIDIKVI